MWTGRQTLEQIEDTITQLHRKESSIDQALASATEDGERLRKERSDAYRQLARIKLDEIMAGRLVRDLDSAEAHAMRLLEARRLRLVTITEQREAAIKELEQAELDRKTAGVQLEQALGAVEDVRLKAEAKVRDSAEWKDSEARFKAAEAVADSAEEKAAAAEKELGAKKKPYDDDRLFTYLRERKFGTSEYSAGNLVRMVDRWMADYIGYTDARANYEMLLEIPLRLKDHAAEQRAKADKLRSDTAAIERAAMVEAGVEDEERALASARHKLAGAYDTVEKKRGVLKLLDQQRDSIVSGAGDQTYDNALRTVADADAHDSIATLQREAKRTGTDADDAIVRSIEALEAKLDGVQKEIVRLRGSAQELAQRRAEVEQVRDQFRQSGYDHPNATFNNDSRIGTILGQILEGVVRSGILWDLLRAGFGTRRYRGRPDFGAPDFPFPFPLPGGRQRGARGGEWREPETRGGWFPPDDFPTLPGGSSGGSWGGGGGSSDDDFTTGGSF